MGLTIECHDYLIVGATATLPLRRPLVAILRMAAFKKTRLLLLRIEFCAGGKTTEQVNGKSRMLRQSVLFCSCFLLSTVLIGKAKVLLADK